MSPGAISLRYALFYATLFVAIGAHLPFWPLWLEGRGLSAAEIGLLLALGSWIKLVANPGLAHLSDRAGWNKGTVVLLTAVSVAVFIAFIPAQGFAWILALHLLAAASFPLLVPLAESQTLAAVYRHGLDYGRIRLWGSLAFIAGSLATGGLIAAYDAEWVLWLMLGPLVLTFFVAVALPGRAVTGTPGDAAEDVSLRRVLRLFTQRGTVTLLCASALIQASHAAYYGFSSLAWRAAGISETTIALLWTEGVVAEILFFAFSRRLADRLAPGTLMMAAGLLGCLRWTVTGLSSDIAALAAVQVLHAATFAATHLAAMHYITRTTPPRLAASMQSLYSALSGGLVMGGTMLLAGSLYESGPGLPFLAMAGLSLAAAVLAFVAGLLPRPRPAV
ncbi:MAG: 3-phenylpropionate MFS transporter [Kiloniellaceae bacterium]